MALISDAVARAELIHVMQEVLGRLLSVGTEEVPVEAEKAH